MSELLSLVGIHAYLGIHVLRRGVIFVDLALAQMAALGATLAVFFGHEQGTAAAYAFALGATFLGAGIFSVVRMRRTRIPQEAIIGIVYAVSAAAGILAMDRAPHGAEQLKSMLVGSILWVTWPTVLRTAAIYAVVGLLHWFFRERFLLISRDEKAAASRGVHVRAWDFLFYATFGFVITISVPIAGVLLVFSFLIVPAVCGTLFSTSVAGELAVGWTVGFVASALGCLLSYATDLPTGATVVCTFGLVLVVLSLAALVARPSSRADSGS
jgi:zinc/manganese transport system permease protein